MGVRRKSRARIAALNKQGLKKDVSPSPLVMSDNIVAATQFRQGQMVITDLVLDLAGTKNTLFTKALAAADPIGTNSTDVSYVCNLGESVFGIVTQVETITMEQPTDGTLKDYDLVYAGDGTLDGHASSGNDGFLGSDATGDAALITDIGIASAANAGVHKIVQIDTTVSARAMQNRYLYLTAGAATTAKASAIIDCSSADTDNVVDQVTTVVLTRDNGTTEVIFQADNSVAWDASHTTDEIFGTGASSGSGGNMDTVAKLVRSISYAINRNSHFSTDATSQANVGNAGATAAAGLITVTVANVTATSNNSNYLVDHPNQASGITVANFTGGMPNQITAGKVLIRVTGFIDPDDL